MVALCANVCHDVVAAVLGARCVPVFLDIDPATGLVPDREWARARAAGATVALVVHLYGNPSDVAAVRRQFPAGACLLIDDAAQALGVRHGTVLAGAAGDVGLLSFGATKHIEVGGAALLLGSTEFAALVRQELADVPVLAESDAAALRMRFRQGLEVARAQLRQRHENAVHSFSGLLNGYPPVLGQEFPLGSADTVLKALHDYPAACTLRQEKARAWASGLAGTGLQPVGMGNASIPWRFTCRLPGLDWDLQHRLGEGMRKRGLNVSHWYLPAHWMCGQPVGSLPGVERLASEIFQFWVDADTSLEQIHQGCASVATVIRETRP
jgi:dTDP-4-amino-4,6-dideoxygalactose transaminase